MGTKQLPCLQAVNHTESYTPKSWEFGAMLNISLSILLGPKAGSHTEPYCPAHKQGAILNPQQIERYRLAHKQGTILSHMLLNFKSISIEGSGTKFKNTGPSPIV